MVSILRLSKLLVKLVLILILLFVILTYQNSSVKKRRMHFQIWKHIFRRRLTNVKYILIWSRDDVQLDILRKKYEAFIENKCIYNNCFVTKDRNLFNNDYRNFDAILFSGKILYNDSTDLPANRFSNQTFVFTSTESADYYPSCDEKFESYFNMTWTYKLDSDVPWPYFEVFDDEGSKIAPRTSVEWKYNMKPVPEYVGNKIIRLKKQGVAWFASNCHTNSKRENFVLLLKIALKRYGIEIDAVGECGTRECPIAKEKECMEVLRHYYFYLALENSISDDYVTEKVLKPLLHYTVPVVFGGANYSRFLPPHSFINAYKLGAKKTAEIMANLIMNHTAYLEYFRWCNHYFVKPSSKSVCSLCRQLNRGETKVYNQFRKWWNPQYNKTCERRNKRSSKKSRSSKLRLGTTCSMGEAPLNSQHKSNFVKSSNKENSRLKIRHTKIVL